MKNTPFDLNNHLVAQIERLSDENLTNERERFDMEVKRGEAIACVAAQYIANCNMMLKAAIVADGFINPKSRLPRIFLEEKNDGKTSIHARANCIS